MPTDHEKNLTVLTDHIRRLVAEQQAAVGLITGANRSIVDPARSMWDTHGLVCSATNFAVSTAETARRAAGGALFRVSIELAEKLDAAATNYDNVDSTEAGNVDTCGV